MPLQKYKTRYNWTIISTYYHCIHLTTLNHQVKACQCHEVKYAALTTNSNVATVIFQVNLDFISGFFWIDFVHFSI